MKPYGAKRKDSMTCCGYNKNPHMHKPTKNYPWKRRAKKAARQQARKEMI